ncbi:MAG: hypothetical protein NVS9B15_10310 [Acidobacteriaceae bacterium]
MARREFLKFAAGAPLLAGFASRAGSEARHTTRPLNIMMKSAWGSDDPTKAAFPFLHGHALISAGHNVRIFLLGEAVGLMRKSEAEAVVPVGWPPLINTMKELAAAEVPIYACGACSRARNVSEADLANWGAKFGSPPIFVSLVEWADRVITEQRTCCCAQLRHGKPHGLDSDAHFLRNHERRLIARAEPSDVLQSVNFLAKSGLLCPRC